MVEPETVLVHNAENVDAGLGKGAVNACFRHPNAGIRIELTTRGPSRYSDVAQFFKEKLLSQYEIARIESATLVVRLPKRCCLTIDLRPGLPPSSGTELNHVLTNARTGFPDAAVSRMDRQMRQRVLGDMVGQK